MSESLKLIVEAYVGLNDREAIQGLREHWQTIRGRLLASSSQWFDTSSLVRLLDNDLNEIEAGLARLQ
ncbi:hypothetical protein [uncultured Bradyrhizobium sp.]|uniref:hypothetical protein n=1 Tax=Bradyrhizobium sp. TaxID=376 RepID=UPI002624F410|nr:hypothetical protein [uncultured Bradyrhizobium sp.]